MLIAIIILSGYSVVATIMAWDARELWLYWRTDAKRLRHDARYTDAEHTSHSCETQMVQDDEARRTAWDVPRD